MRVCVDGSTVGEVISGWTGIPTGKMVTDEMSTALNWSSISPSGSSARTTR
ncbi:MAG: hypothetical protein U0133_10985 [Gemmatimonadales bacterium]